MPVSELSAAATLELWEAADGLPPVERSLALAAAAGGAPVDEVARLPLGRRDALLLGLLGQRELEATAPCPECGEQAEFALDATALVAREPAPVEPLRVGETVVEWRPPDTLDVAAAAAAGDAASAEAVLLARCVSSPLAPEARAAIAAAMAEADPLAEVLVDVACPACGTSFVVDLDVASFAWADVRSRAKRLLHDVDVLARVYGWTEREVLALDDRRRAAYLELAGA
ncbi:MAG: hypothetical protein ACJ76U_07785 [Gaiellaceae bacterium]